jgi:hypothetical protein
MAEFIVHASNIHTGESQDYGPFAGPPQLTYELLRANEDEGPPFEIFQWFDPHDDVAGDHDYASWTDLEGNTRYDGWRHLERIVDTTTGNTWHSSHLESDGPFWTDLFLCDPATYDRLASLPALP